LKNTCCLSKNSSIC